MRALLVAALFALPAAAAGECRLVKIAEWPVRLQAGVPVVTASLNGQEIGVLIDTGASQSVVYRTAVDRLKLMTRPADSYRVIGVGGESAAEIAFIDEFRLGKAVRTNWRVLAAGSRSVGRDFEFVLGEDFLENVDLELDYPNGKVRLFQPQGCDGASLAYWDPRRSIEVALVNTSPVYFNGRINDADVRILLDTGFSLSTVTVEAASRFGVQTGAPGVERIGCGQGLGSRRLDIWAARFASLSIGDQTIHDPMLAIADLWKHWSYTDIASRLGRSPSSSPAMVLGTDFLRAHRVLIARSQKKLYFTYTGGVVFPAERGPSCDQLTRK